jgi:hypothetical protein
VEGREEPRGTIPLAGDAAVDELELIRVATPPSLFLSLWLAPPLSGTRGREPEQATSWAALAGRPAQCSLFVFGKFGIFIISQI